MVEKIQMPVLYTTEEIRQIFKCGKRQAYELMHTKGFPTIKIGRKLYVEQGLLDKWIQQNTGRSVIKSS